MPKLTGEKLLQASFLEHEWKALAHNQKFMDRREKAQTIDDFQQLCIFGFSLIANEGKRQDLSHACSADFL